jgi:tetratricopeptide (TPR) repeat protein
VAFRLNDDLPPAPDDGEAEIRRLVLQLETGVPADKQIALDKLVALRAEAALAGCLQSANPVAAQLATAGLWQCWLNEQGTAAHREIMKGIQRMEAGELEDALEIFVRLVRKYPRWAEAHNKHATVLYLLGNARMSYKVCQLVVELKPHHFGAWNGMALCAAHLEKWQAALDAAQRALALQPSAQANRDIIQLAQARLREKD